MQTMLAGAVAVLGLITGSFLNVVVLRLGTGESIVRGRSRCAACAASLRWHELLPVLSFLLQGGRCKRCGTRISWQYPAVEIATGVVFLFLWLRVQPQAQFPMFNFQTIFSFLLAAAIASLLIAISVYDIRHQIIPNQLVYPFIVLAFVFVVFGSLHVGFMWDSPVRQNLGLLGDAGIWRSGTRYSLLTGAVLFTFFALLWLVSRGRWMGLGDAKLALGLGWWLGWPVAIPAMVLAFWLGAATGAALLLRARFQPGVSRARYTLKSQIPFGPFLVIGGLLLFFADLFFHVPTPIEFFSAGIDLI